MSIVLGPATVRMISENGPAFPLPLHLPPGHMVQQVLDENGVLTHVIMSQPGPPPPPPPLPHHHMVKQKIFNSKCHSSLFSIPVILPHHSMEFMVIHINTTIQMSMDLIQLIHYLFLHVLPLIIHRLHLQQIVRKSLLCFFYD